MCLSLKKSVSKDSRWSKQSHPVWVLAEAMLSHPLCMDTQAKTERGAEWPTAALGHCGYEQLAQLHRCSRALSYADQNKTNSTVALSNSWLCHFPKYSPLLSIPLTSTPDGCMIHFPSSVPQLKYFLFCVSLCFKFNRPKITPISIFELDEIPGDIQFWLSWLHE